MTEMRSTTILKTVSRKLALIRVHPSTRAGSDCESWECPNPGRWGLGRTALASWFGLWTWSQLGGCCSALGRRGSLQVLGSRLKTHSEGGEEVRAGRWGCVPKCWVQEKAVPPCKWSISSEEQRLFLPQWQTFWKSSKCDKASPWTHTQTYAHMRAHTHRHTFFNFKGPIDPQRSWGWWTLG